MSSREINPQTLLRLQFKCVNFHRFQSDRKRFLDGRPLVERRQRRRENPVAKIVGKKTVEAEFAASGRTVETQDRETTVEAETVQNEGDGRRRLDGFVVGQFGARTQVDNVNIRAAVGQGRLEIGMQLLVVQLVVPNQVMDGIQKALEDAMSCQRRISIWPALASLFPISRV